MPLGNLTSQFFANVYLNELDYFVKHELKAKHYIRYVDDFVILHDDKHLLEKYKAEIGEFLREKLKIGLHPDKSKILLLGNSLNFLGFRVFYYHKLLKKPNIRKMRASLKALKEEYARRETEYDMVYDYLEGWLAYARNANAHKLRKKIAEQTEIYFSNEMSTKEINLYFQFCKKTIRKKNKKSAAFTSSAAPSRTLLSAQPASLQQLLEG